VLVLGVPKHAAGIDLAFVRTRLVDDGFFQFMVSVFSQDTPFAAIQRATKIQTSMSRKFLGERGCGATCLWLPVCYGS